MIERLLLPPLNALLLAALGLLLWKRHRRLGSIVLALAGLLFYVLSAPFTSALLLRSLEPAPVAPERAVGARDAGAVVVLGADLCTAAPEYGGPTVGRLTLLRMRYAAVLARRTALPLLVSGGDIWGAGVTVSEAMREVFASEFGLDVRWIERTSRNTHQNAIESSAILAKAGVRTVYLVTDAWHMPRASQEFRKAGLTVIEAPTGFTRPPPLRVRSFLPASGAMVDSAHALHEILGRIWYSVRY